MGFLDTLLGRSKLPKAKPDKLFAMSTAYITMSSILGLSSIGAGICFKPLDASKYMTAEIEIRELLQQSCKETNTQYQIKKDSYGYLWVTLNDPEFEDLVSTVYLVSSTLTSRVSGSSFYVRSLSSKGKILSSGYLILNRGHFILFRPMKKKGLII